MRIIFISTFVFSFGILTQASLAGKNCSLMDPSDDRVTHREHGAVPYINGEISYDSRRQIANGRAAYIWSITENTTGYVIQAKWGTDSNDKKFMPPVSVKNNNTFPRCRIRSSGRNPDADDHNLKYKRKGNSSWELEEAPTVFPIEKTSVILEDLFDILRRGLIGKAHAQNRIETEKLIVLYQSGALPATLARHFSNDGVFDVDGVLRDPLALQDYFSLGFKELSYYSVLISDIPINSESFSLLFSNEEIQSEDMTPIYVYVESGVRPGPDNRLTSYLEIYSEILTEDLAKNFNPNKFSAANVQIVPQSESEFGAFFENAIEENQNVFAIDPNPGKGTFVPISGNVGESFDSISDGRLFIRTADNEIPAMEFDLILAKAN